MVLSNTQQIGGNMDKVIGSCGNCGGDVTIPENWMSTAPAEPTCKSCGAKAKKKLPKIDMVDSKPSKISNLQKIF